MIQKYLAGLNRTYTLYSLFWRNLKLNNYFNTHVTRGSGHRVVAVVVMIVIGHRRELWVQAIAHGHGTLDMMRGMRITHEERAHDGGSGGRVAPEGIRAFYF